jgi:hypothetical protein
MDLKKLLAAFTSKPKTLPQAQVTLDEASATLGKVEALFSVAGLNLEAMLGAGPDSLKAHLESLTTAEEEVGTMKARVTELEGLLATAQGDITKAAGELATASEIMAAVGIKPETKREEWRPAFDAHVKAQAALELAKAGHPPVEHKATEVEATTATAAQKDEARLAEYEKMAAGPDRAKFFAEHEQAIFRAHRARAAANG